MEIIYHPERITTPLIRVGSREKGRFEKTSWNHALEVISEHLIKSRDKWGAESLVFGTGTTRGMPPWLNRFLTLFGSPNLMAPSNMSGGPLVIGSTVTCGFQLMYPDYAATKCMVLWAHNPEASWPGLWLYHLNQSLKNGAKLIVIDPRPIPLTQRADHWLQIRPGTDVALALCFINVIIKEALYDKAFVEKWTYGFDKIREHVTPFTIERCSEITWIPADKIEAAIYTFANSKPACIGPGMAGVCQSNDAFDLSRSLTILSAITGNLEVPGGNLNFVQPTLDRHCYGDAFCPTKNLPPEQAQKKLGTATYPIFGLAPIPSPVEAVWKAILEEDPYPVKTIGLFANNALCAYANSPQVKKALSALEFLFVVDYFHTPTTQLADIVLPPAHWTERDDIEDLLMKNYVFCQQKAVDPIPECRCEKQILIDLASKVGLSGYWSTVEESLNYRLEPTGLRFDELKRRGMVATPVVYRSYEKNNGFLTLSGKVELSVDYLEPLGISPLPNFREPPESPVSRPDLWDQYPLILTTGGRNVVYYHSAHRNIKSLHKRTPDPVLDMHPETAQTLGLVNEQWVYLISPRAKVEIRLRLVEGIHPRVVHAPHGYWYGVDEGWQRLNINMITDNQPQCPVTASVPLKALLCRVEKME